MADSVILNLRLVAETGSAYGVTEDKMDDEAIWLPKSQVDMITHKPDIGDVVEVDVPEWLAIDRGLS